MSAPKAKHAGLAVDGCRVIGGWWMGYSTDLAWRVLEAEAPK